MFKKAESKEVKYYTVLAPDGSFDLNRIRTSEKDAEEDFLNVGLGIGYSAARDIRDNKENYERLTAMLKKEGFRVSQILIKPYP